MSEDKHTPGPWAILNAGGTNQIMPAMRPGMIADSVDSYADARLISEAPNLLAACQLLVEIIRGEDDDPEWREEVVASTQMSIRIVEGREP